MIRDTILKPLISRFWSELVLKFIRAKIMHGLFNSPEFNSYFFEAVRLVVRCAAVGLPSRKRRIWPRGMGLSAPSKEEDKPTPL